MENTYLTDEVKLFHESLCRAYGFDPYYYKNPSYKPDKGFVEWLDGLSTVIKTDMHDFLIEYTKSIIQDMTPEQKEELKQELKQKVYNRKHNRPLVAIWFEDICKVIDGLNN